MPVQVKLSPVKGYQWQGLLPCSQEVAWLGTGGEGLRPPSWVVHQISRGSVESQCDCAWAGAANSADSMTRNAPARRRSPCRELAQSRLSGPPRSVLVGAPGVCRALRPCSARCPSAGPGLTRPPARRPLPHAGARAPRARRRRCCRAVSALAALRRPPSLGERLGAGAPASPCQPGSAPRLSPQRCPRPNREGASALVSPVPGPVDCASLLLLGRCLHGFSLFFSRRA